MNTTRAHYDPLFKSSSRYMSNRSQPVICFFLDGLDGTYSLGTVYLITYRMSNGVILAYILLIQSTIAQCVRRASWVGT